MMTRIAMMMALLAGPVCAGELSYDQAKASADRDEASLSPGPSEKLTESQGKAIESVMPGCALSIPKPGGHPDLTPFVVVMQLDGSGRIVRTWLHGTTPLAVCFHHGIAGRLLFVPPRAPFYTSIEMNLTEGSGPMRAVPGSGSGQHARP